MTCNTGLPKADYDLMPFFDILDIGNIMDIDKYNRYILFLSI